MCDARYRSKRARAIPRPRWGLLYGIVLVTGAAAIGVQFASLPASLRTALVSGLAFGGLVAMAVWVRSNGAALDLQDWCDCAAEKMTVRVIPPYRQAPSGFARPSVPDDPPIEDDEEALTVSAAER